MSESLLLHDLRGTAVVVHCKTKGQFVKVSQLCGYSCHRTKHYNDLPDKAYINLEFESYWSEDKFLNSNDSRVILATQFLKENNLWLLENAADKFVCDIIPVIAWLHEEMKEAKTQKENAKDVNSKIAFGVKGATLAKVVSHIDSYINR